MASSSHALAEAVGHHRGGRLADAERLYRDMLRAAPDQPDAYHLLGLIAAQSGQFAVAEGWIARAVVLAPARGDFHASLGNVLYAQNKFREGAESYKRAFFHACLKRAPVTADDLLDYAARPPASPDGRAANLSLYHSQTLQDLFLDRWVFRGMEKGTFVDIGAHDGLTYSNSVFFEQWRGWQGICIEPNPVVFRRLVVNRPSARNLHCAIAPESGSQEFLKLSGFPEMLSGLVKAYDEDHRQRIANELKLHGGSSEVITVMSRTFPEVVAEAGFSDVTYLSIDTEGGELAILNSIDFRRVFIHAATVECGEKNFAAMTGLMQTRGFEMIKNIGPDLLFINRASPFFPAYEAVRRR